MAEETISGVTPAPPAGTIAEQGQGQPPEKPQADHKEVEGQRIALEAERRKRQQAEEDARRARIRAELLEDMAARTQKPAYDPDDIPLYKDVESIVNEKVGAVRGEYRQREMALQVQQARLAHNDYDDVFQLACDLAEQTPGIAEIIINSPNAAEAAYAFGRTHPSYAQKTQQKTTQQVAEQINNNLNSTKTLSDAGGGSVPSQQKDWRRASHDEIEKKIRDVRGY